MTLQAQINTHRRNKLQAESNLRALHRQLQAQPTGIRYQRILTEIRRNQLILRRSAIQIRHLQERLNYETQVNRTLQQAFPAPPLRRHFYNIPERHQRWANARYDSTNK